MSAVTVRVLDEHLATVRRHVVDAETTAGRTREVVLLAAEVQRYADKLAKAPRLVLAGHLARLTAATLAGPRLTAEIANLAAQIGYAVRPYDQLADTRRWRWQPAAQFGLRGLDPAGRERLLAAVRDDVQHQRPEEIR